MRRGFLSCVLFLLVAGVAAADEVYLPSNTPGTGRVNGFPFNNQWGSEWRYQLVIPAASLGRRSMKILDISFAPSGTGDFKATTFEVRMSHSTVAPSKSFATNLPNPKVMFLSSAFVWKTTHQTWSSIGLTSPFLYNGTDYLTIELRFKGGAKGNGFSGNCYQDQGSIWRVYNNAAGAYTATTGSTGASNVKARLSFAGGSIIPSGTAKPGSTLDLNLSAPADGGLTYQLATSLGQGPIPLPGGRKIELSLDALLDLSVNGKLPTVFVNYRGKLAAAGTGQGKINIPNIPALKGVGLYNAFLTLRASAPGGVQTISSTILVTIQ